MIESRKQNRRSEEKDENFFISIYTNFSKIREVCIYRDKMRETTKRRRCERVRHAFAERSCGKEAHNRGEQSRNAHNVQEDDESFETRVPLKASSRFRGCASLTTVLRFIHSSIAASSVRRPSPSPLSPSTWNRRRLLFTHTNTLTRVYTYTNVRGGHLARIHREFKRVFVRWVLQTSARNQLDSLLAFSLGLSIFFFLSRR